MQWQCQFCPEKQNNGKNSKTRLTTTYAEQFAESRRKLNVHERTFFQTTPMGDFVIVTLEGEDPQNAFTNFASGKDDFTEWFKNEVKEIHGFDLANPPEGRLPELLIDSKAGVLQN